MTTNKPTIRKASPPDWRYIGARLPLLFIASIISSISVTLFLRPAEIVAGGLTGIGLILNLTTGFPLGVFTLIGNVIMLAIGYRQLGGWNVVVLTMFFVVFFSINVEWIGRIMPPEGISDDRFLNAVYAGIVGGISGGLVYRAGSTMGGSSIISRIIHNRFGVPTSSAYLYVDSFVILAAGYFFGWDASLFSLIALMLDGIVADYVLEGPSLIRTATIITDKPEAVSREIMYRLNRGATTWTGTGAYTQQAHTVLFVTITRAQVGELRDVVDQADPQAFVVIGHGHVAYGSGFKTKGRAGKLPRPLPAIDQIPPFVD